MADALYNRFIHDKIMQFFKNFMLVSKILHISIPFETRTTERPSAGPELATIR